MKKILLGLVLSFLVSTSANASIIDSFDDFQGGAGTITLPGSLGDFNASADRELGVTGPGVPFIGGGAFTFMTFGAADFGIIWNDFDGTDASLSPAISSIPGALSFVLQGVSWDGALDFDLSLVLDGTEFAVATASAGAVGENVEFLFTDFLPAADLLDITEIALVGSTTEAGSFTAEALVVTPEPSSLILGGIGLLMMGGYGYRRRRKSADTNTASV